MSDAANRDQRIESIFIRAKELPATQRGGFLKEACEGDEQLRVEVHDLLAVDLASDSFLDQPIELDATIAPAEGSAVSEGSQIGRYKLLQKLGEGGFGVVYMAEQTEPVRRKVAFKIIKPGMDSNAVIARFEAERQALAMMDHPNIARVFDGGSTENGWPYFVMELVKGVSITQYCDKKRLSTSERLELFVDVCKAVQHAHTKGVIHRDLKPSNVMITLHDGKPVVKVIDFGVAKAINQQLTTKTLFTRYGQMVGTPQYMSPEQAEMSGLDVDTRSDIYSLGVLLYELMTGSTPLTAAQFSNAGYAEMQRMICEEDLAKPSTRLHTTTEQDLADIADHRGVTAADLQKELQGDLDWVIMKTLEKERDRRYQTPVELAEDINRFLGDEAVKASRPSFSYRFRKYVRRNRGFVVSATTLATVLVAATIISSTQALKALRAEQVAQERLQDVTLAQQDAEAARDLAEENATQLKSQLYLTNMSQAQRDAEILDYRAAHEHLNACPVEFREWEWRWLNRNLRPDYAHTYDGRELAWFLPDNQRFMTVSDTDGVRDKIHIWSAVTGDLVEEIDTPIGPLTMSALHPDGNLAAIADANGSVSLVNLSSRRTLWTRTAAHSGKVDGIAFSRNGSRLATVGHGGKLIVWSTDAGEVQLSQETLDELRCVQFDPTDRYIVSATTWDGPARVWDAKTGKVLDEFDHFGHGASCVAISPDGAVVASGGGDGLIFVRSLDSREVVQLHSTNSTVSAITYSPDGRQLIASGVGGDVFIFDTQGGQLRQRLRSGQRESLWTAMSEDSKYLTSFGSMGGKGFSTCVFDLAEGKNHHRIQHFGPAHLVQYSPSGERLLSTGWGRRLLVIDSVSGQLLRAMYGHSSSIASTAWSRDGRNVYSQDMSGHLLCWNVETGEVQWDTRVPSNTDETPGWEFGGGLGVSPDDKLLFAPWADGTVCVFDASNGQLVRRLQEHKGAVNSVTFSSDGRLFATAGADLKIVLWQTESLRPKVEFEGHAENIRDLAFSQDDKLLASASYDGTVRLWDVATGRLRQSLSGHERGLWVVRFSASGNRVFATDGRGEKIVWDTNTGAISCRWKISRDIGFDIHPTTGTVASSEVPSGDITLWEIADQSIETIQHRRTLAEARGVVAIVKATIPLAEDQAAAIRSTESTDVAVIDAALAHVQTLGDDPYAINKVCWQSLTTADTQDLERALSWISRARKKVDCSEYALTESLLLLRLGRFSDANALLADQIVPSELLTWDADEFIDRRTGYHAAMAICLAHLNNSSKATEQLVLARKSADAEPKSVGPVTQHLLRQAEALLASPKKR